MPLKFKCHCGTVLTVPTQRVGKSVRCPFCNETLVIPVPPSQGSSPTVATNRLESASSPEDEHGKQAGDVESGPARREPPANPIVSIAVKPGRADQQTERIAQPIEKLGIDEPVEPKAVFSSEPDGTPSSADKPASIQTPDLAERDPADEATVAFRSPTADPLHSKAGDEKQVPPGEPHDVVKRPPPIKPRSAARATAPPPLPKQFAKRRQTPTSDSRGTQDSQPQSDKKQAAARSKADEASRGPRSRGVEHARANRWTAYYLALGVILVALINIAPAFYQGVQALRDEPAQPFARWTYGALILGLIQMAYAVYLIQLPDWSSVWVVAVLSLVVTTLYAALVSVVLLGGNDSGLLQSLQLAHGLRRSAALWCLIMLIVSASLTYAAGRVGIRWHKIYSDAYPVVVKRS